MDIIKQAVVTIIGTSIVGSGILAVFIFAFKKMFEQSLSHLSQVQIKRTESELALKTQTALRELENLEKREYLKFSKLHEERAEAIKKAYEKLSSIHGKAAYLVYRYDFKEKNPELFEHEKQPKDGDPFKWEQYTKTVLTVTKEEALAKEATIEVNQFTSQFRLDRIYFDRHTASEIDRFTQLLHYVVSEFQNVSFRDPKTFEVVVAQKVVETWKKCANSVAGIFPGLEDRFREYLGVTMTK